MRKYTLILFLAIVPIVALADDLVRFKDGQLLKVRGEREYKPVSDDNLAFEEIEGVLLDTGFPAFKSWSIKNDDCSTLPVLEAIVISAKTGDSIQNIQIYLEYEGCHPRLFAISDADGRIKMRIQQSINLLVIDDEGWPQNNGTAKLVRIYIGEPTQKGSHTRVYNVSGIQNQ